MEYFDYLKCSGGGGGAKEPHPQPNSGIRLSKLLLKYDVISYFHSVSRQPKMSAIIISL